jgi:hypothetical protein
VSIVVHLWFSPGNVPGWRFDRSEQAIDSERETELPFSASADTVPAWSPIA